ncbi:Hint domain-containing protein [Lichenicola sp.]|uniref:Hint domain-containing protein n=1 Tax=Lichenicola sp. TaxID=2804529 RepID=UPI003AFFC596
MTEVTSGSTSTGLIASPINEVIVDAGGTAIDTTVIVGGVELVHGGGVEMGADVLLGGTLYLDEDGGGIGILDGGTIELGGLLSGEADGLLLGTVTNSGTAAGNLQVSGTLAGGVYSGGGRLLVDAGGVISGVTVENDTYVGAGGTATHDTILAYEEIQAGGTALSETVSGGSLYIDAGATGSGTVISTGFEYVRGGGSETGAIVSSGGTLFLDADGGGVGRMSGGTIVAGGILSGLADGLLLGTVLNSGTAEGTLDVSGILSGGVYSGGGRLQADAGGVISGVLIENTTYVGAGGTATHDTIVAYEEIQTGGTALSETVSGGSLYIDAGATGSGTVIGTGFEYVRGGGIETNALVSGTLYLDQDGGGIGVMSGGTIAAGGILSGLADGLLLGTVTNDGTAEGSLQVSGTLAGGIYGGAGRLLADAGGVVSGVMIENATYAGSGGTLTHDAILAREEIYAGGTALSETVSGGSLFIDGSATGSGTVISTGYEYVHGGGSETDAIVSSGGTLFLDADGNGVAMMSGGTIVAGGILSGLADGLLLGTVTNSGTAEGTLDVSGILSGGVYSGGGRLLADAGGVISGVTLENTTVVAAGGTATHDTIVAGEEAQNGGTALSETVSGGSLYIDAGATGSGTVIGTGFEYVRGGGIEINALVSGTLYLDQDGGGIGVMSGGTIAAGGILSGLADGLLLGTVTNDGTAEGSLQVSGILSGGVYSGGGRLQADAGGVISGVTLENTTLVAAGGTATHDTIVASEEVQTGGTALSETVSGGSLFIDDGATGSGTVISAGYELVHGGGSETDAVVSGTLYLDADGHGIGVMSGGTIAAGGVLSGYADGLLLGTVTNSGTADGNLQVSGTLTGGIYSGGGRLIADTGGVVSGVTLENTTYAEAGGTFTQDTILAYQEIQGGGTALSEILSAGGSLTIDAGGTGSATTITNGATELVRGGGSEINAMIESGGTLYVDADGNGYGNAIFAGGGTLTESGTISGGGDVIVSGPGTVVLATSNGYTGGSIISGGTLELGTVSAAGSGAISFADPGTLRIDTAAAPTNVISGFGSGDFIDLGAYAYSPGADSILVSGDTVTVTTPTGTVSLDIAGASTVMPRLDQAADGTILVEAPCFAAGTRLLGPAGEVAVEEVKAGDMLVVREDGRDLLRAVSWVGERRLEPARHPNPARVNPVRFAPGSLDVGIPSRPLRLSPDHALLLDGVLIAARQLVNGSSITIESVPAVHYFHVELERHGILIAEGAEAESYLDTGNRCMFSNGGAPLALHADFSRSDDSRAVAPLVTAAARVQPIWEALAARAVVLGHEVQKPATSRDAALQLVMTDGTSLEPEQRSPGGRHMFLLRPGCQTRLTLRSRHAAPADTMPWLDDRRSLGVAVGHICVWTSSGGLDPVAIGLETLEQGWWALEADETHAWRWTDGEADLMLPPEAILVEITVVATLEYPVVDTAPAAPRRLVASA